MEELMKRFKLLLTCLMLTMPLIQLIQPSDTFSCVGRVLNVAIYDTIDQNILGQMLAVFINERTGTTIELKKAATPEECFELIKKGDADIFIGYIGSPIAKDAKKLVGSSTDETYSLVKQYYRAQYGMVILKPFGYKGPVKESGPVPGASLAVPITTRKVLDRFPILDRVINKLSDKIDDDTLKILIEEFKKESGEQVVKNFLKKRNMI